MNRLGLLATFCTLLVAAETAQARRIALVIGNATYAAAGMLTNPMADATLISEALRKSGFDSVEVKRNLSRTAMESALRDFGVQAEGAEVALIYYAGHGVEAGGQNYLIPVDAQLKRDRDLDVEATRLDTVLRLVEGAKLRVVVLDACRNNPFVSQMQRSARTRSIGRGLAMVEPEGDTLVVYAAKAGATAADGDTSNSPFAEALAKNLPRAGIEISLLFRAVRDDVLQKTGRTQEPFTYGSLSGTAFYFVPPRNDIPSAPVQPPPAASNEALYWQGVLSTNSETAYRGYLKRYPNGDFAELATENLNRLTTKPASVLLSANTPQTPARKSTVPALADCIYPKTPGKIPDGSSATLEEMVGVKKQVDRYNNDMESYLSCINLEHDDAISKQGETMTSEQKTQLEHRHVQKHDAAVDELQGVADRFNEQVRAYKAKHQKK